MFLTFAGCITRVQQHAYTGCSPGHTSRIQRRAHSWQLHIDMSSVRQQQLQTLPVTWWGKTAQHEKLPWQIAPLHSFTYVHLHTFLSGLMDGWSQLVVGVAGGAVLQDEPGASSTPATAGVEERCGTICWYYVHLWSIYERKDYDWRSCTSSTHTNQHYAY